MSVAPVGDNADFDADLKERDSLLASNGKMGFGRWEKLSQKAL